MRIYKITNKITSKIYVGQTVRSLEKRLASHLYTANKGSNTKLSNSIRKYGIDNFTIEEIEICNSHDQLNEREIYWISKLNSISSGYNIAHGGLGHKMDPSTIKKLADKRRGVPLSDETKRKISIANKGKHKSKPSEITRDKISLKLKQYYSTHEKPTNPTLGKFGNLHHFYGKNHTHETKQKISVARKGKKYEDVMDKSTCLRLKSIRKLKWSGESNPSYKSVPIEEILKIINLYPLTTAQDLSKKYNISYPTIIDKFKRYTGYTFEEYKKIYLGFNHGIYKRLKNLGIDRSEWMSYNSDYQHQISCKNERSNNQNN